MLGVGATDLALTHVMDKYRTGIILEYLGNPRLGHTQKTQDTKWSNLLN